mgnify:CR=1 FL=1
MDEHPVVLGESHAGSQRVGLGPPGALDRPKSETPGANDVYGGQEDLQSGAEGDKEIVGKTQHQGTIGTWLQEGHAAILVTVIPTDE